MQILTRTAPLLALTVAAVALFAAQPAGADCACMCLDGAYRTVCTAPEEVQANLHICEAKAQEGCPISTADVEPEFYESPVEGAGNCRSAQIFDARANEYLTTKVCEAASVTTGGG